VGLVFGYYSFQHERKSLFYATLSVYFISVFLGVLSASIHLYYAASFFVGIGIGRAMIILDKLLNFAFNFKIIYALDCITHYY